MASHSYASISNGEIRPRSVLDALHSSHDCFKRVQICTKVMCKFGDGANFPNSLIVDWADGVFTWEGPAV